MIQANQHRFMITSKCMDACDGHARFAIERRTGYGGSNTEKQEREHLERAIREQEVKCEGKDNDDMAGGDSGEKERTKARIKARTGEKAQGKGKDKVQE